MSRSFGSKLIAAVKFVRKGPPKRGPLKGFIPPNNHSWITVRISRQCATCHQPVLPGKDALWHRPSGQLWCLTCAAGRCQHLSIAPLPGVQPPADWIPGTPLPKQARQA